MFSRLWKCFRELAQMWMRSDAIRSSSTDRVWLAVRPPCVMVWEGERIQVLHRSETPTEQGLTVRLECQTPRGREDLIIRPGNLHQRPRWEWIRP